MDQRHNHRAQHPMKPLRRLQRTIGILALASLLSWVALFRCDGPTNAQDAGPEPTAQSEAGNTQEPAPTEPTKTEPQQEPGNTTEPVGPDALVEKLIPKEEAPQEPRWEEHATLSNKRQETAVVALNGEVIIVGGITGTRETVATVEAYNPSTKKWRTLADLPAKMHHANVAAYKGKLYVLGFLAPSFSADGRCFVYDPQTDKWSTIAEMSRETRRGASAVAVIGDKIYVAGGLRGIRSVTDLTAYDPAKDSWETLAPIPTDLDHLAGGPINGLFVLAGGRHGGISSHIKKTFTYDPNSNKWEEKAEMPTSRGGTAAAVYKGRLYVFGGEGNKADGTGVFDQVESYELSTNTWRQHPPMKDPRHGTGAATIGDKIYIPGGADVQAFGAVDTVDAYIPGF